MPFKHLGSNFSNVGFGLGTEVSYNGRQDWVQQFMVAWHRNAPAGNSLMVYTQAVWRSDLVDYFFTEFKAGLGYSYSFRPVRSYRQKDGEWVSAGRSGKGMLALPLGIGAGYNKFSGETYFSPFAGYQLLLLKDYSKSIPLVPQTIIEAGTRIHIKKYSR